jgi:protoporphyrinogen oxidase
MKRRRVRRRLIGAGPAGLTAAWELTRKSTLRVGILEADPVYVGGISRTQRYKGFLFDIGGHRFFSKSQEIERLWSEMLPGDFLLRPRKSRILYDRALYSYPLRAFEALRNLGLWEACAAWFHSGRARLLPSQPRTFHEWVANQFGERLYSIFFRTYTEKVWGMSCDELSADWAAQRIKGLNLGAAMLDALIRSLGLSRGGGAPAGRDTVKTLIESFRYPRKGPGMLWESVATTVQESGARLFMGRQAVQFTRDEITGGWTVEVRRDDGTRRSVPAVT